MKKFVLILALSGCVMAPLPPVDPGPAPASWVMQSLNGQPFLSRATLSFTGPGLTGPVVGQAPCNGYSGNQTRAYPSLRITDLTATEMACDALPDEGRYFAALAAMSQAEALGSQLILTSTSGQRMVFYAAPPVE